jgi:CBS domain-containing protein
MSVGRICSRVVATVSPRDSVAQGATRMREFGVGSLVVVDDRRKPLGILTDRDIVLRVVATGLDPAGTLASDVMSAPVGSVNESTPLEEALEVMDRRGVRRLAVTGEEGALAGIFAIDDALEFMIGELNRVRRVLEKQGRASGGSGGKVDS